MKSVYRHIAASVIITVSTALVFTQATAEDRTLQPSPAEIMPKAISSTLLDIKHTGSHFIVAGDRGHVLTSPDGEQWTQVEVPVRAMLNRIRMKDANQGWIVGHDASILGTTDGGQSWKLLHFDAQWGKPLYDILFLDDDRGIAVGSNGRMLKTTDGGENWEDAEGPLPDLGLHLNVILQLADGTLFIAGERSLLARSTDQGDTWEMLSSPYSGSWFNALPYGQRGVVAFGLRGNTYVTEDVTALQIENFDEWDEYGVVTQTDPQALAEMGWKAMANPVVQSLFGGTKFSDREVVLVGVNGTIVKGDLGGEAFTAVNSDLDAPLSAAIIVNNKLYVVGRNGVDSMDW